MPTTTANSPHLVTSGRRRTVRLQRNAACPTARVAAATCLMGSGTHLLTPCLDRVPLEHQFHAGERAATRLAGVLLGLDIAEPGDWQQTRRDPTEYVRATLNRWIDLHGGKAIRRRFCLRLMLSEVVDEYLEGGEPDPDGRRLYLFLHPDSAAYVVAGPTLELLEREHPRLAVTFYRLFTGAIGRWTRIYDFRDAEDRVQMLRDWAEGEEEQYEIADVAGSTPSCMKRDAFTVRGQDELKTLVRNGEAQALIKGALELERASAEVARPECTDDIREQLADTDPPLPAALVVFAENDAIEAHFEDESQTFAEATPEPNLILPLNAFDPKSVRSAFHTLAVVCQSLAAASRLIDLMPGNEKWVTDSEADHGSSSGDRS